MALVDRRRSGNDRRSGVPRLRGLAIRKRRVQAAARLPPLNFYSHLLEPPERQIPIGGITHY